MLGAYMALLSSVITAFFSESIAWCAPDHTDSLPPLAHFERHARAGSGFADPHPSG